jgi:hypothetical protein
VGRGGGPGVGRAVDGSAARLTSKDVRREAEEDRKTRPCSHRHIWHSLDLGYSIGSHWNTVHSTLFDIKNPFRTGSNLLLQRAREQAL